MTKQTPAFALTLSLVLFCLSTFARAADSAPMAAASPALPATTPAATSAAPVSTRAPLKMTSTVIGKIDHKFFGANFLYWIENKKALADGKIETLLKDLPISLLRYPGGTVADNFHWETTTLDNPHRFPYTTPASVPDMTTFDDFMAVCARTGAEPMLVVNTESWVLHNDIAGGIKEAADWVRYCKTKNYKVKYWEIGNETYWHAIMTGREYGALVKRYAQAMRAVDPTIIIGANGHWDKDNVGVKERFPRDQWTTVRQRALAIANEKDGKAFDTYERDTHAKNSSGGGEKWWAAVLDECGKDIDMMIVHGYYTVDGWNNVTQLDTKFVELMKFAKVKTGRDYLLCVSEYSCKSENEPNGWGMAEGVCRMLNGGATLGTIWPLRYGGGNDRRAVLTTNTKDAGKDKLPRYPYQILKLFSDNFDGDIIKCAGTDKLFLFATKSPAQITLVVSARGNAKNNAAEGDYEIAFDPDAAKGKITSVVSFATDAKAVLRQTTPSYTPKSNGMSLHIVPGTFTMIIIKRPVSP